jgi:hypothetical protein
LSLIIIPSSISLIALECRRPIYFYVFACSCNMSFLHSNKFYSRKIRSSMWPRKCLATRLVVCIVMPKARILTWFVETVFLLLLLLIIYMSSAAALRYHCWQFGHLWSVHISFDPFHCVQLLLDLLLSLKLVFTLCKVFLVRKDLLIHEI